MSNINDVDIGNILKEIRIEKGVSQESLARQLNKGQSDIAKIESGQKKITFLDFLSFCMKLGLSMKETTSLIELKFQNIWKNKSLWSDE